MKVGYFLVLVVVARQIFQMYKMERAMLVARDAFIEWRVQNPGVYVGLSDTGCRLLHELIVAYDRFVHAHSFWCNESYREYYASLFNDVPPDAPKDMPVGTLRHLETGAFLLVDTFLLYSNRICNNSKFDVEV